VEHDSTPRVALCQVQGRRFLIDGGAVERQQGNALGVRQGFRALPEQAGQMLGMVRKVLEEDVLLPQIALHAPPMVEQAGFAGQAQAIESGQDKQHKRPKAR